MILDDMLGMKAALERAAEQEDRAHLLRAADHSNAAKLHAQLRSTAARTGLLERDNLEDFLAGVRFAVGALPSGVTVDLLDGGLYGHNGNDVDQIILRRGRVIVGRARNPATRAGWPFCGVRRPPEGLGVSAADRALHEAWWQELQCTLLAGGWKATGGVWRPPGYTPQRYKRQESSE